MSLDKTFIRTYLKSITKRYRGRLKTGSRIYRLSGSHDLGYFDLDFLEGLPDRQYGQKLMLKYITTRAKAERLEVTEEKQ